MAQDYQTKGCSQYGAQMGRREVELNEEGTLTIRHVALTDGYDHGGAYWGGPDNLYMVTDGEQGVCYLRGTPDSVRAQFPKATWEPVTEGPTVDDIDEMLEAYIDAALWSELDDDGEPLDSNYNYNDLGDGVRESMRADCEKFANKVAAYIMACFGTGKCSWSQAGHDFWMTRNGHGVGFWDGDWPKPYDKYLTGASKDLGGSDLYVGDDGKLYVS